MATFIGDYTCKVDVKVRIILPAAFKKQLPADAPDHFVVRKDIFEKMNAKRAAEGITLFANARNTATGGLRIKDPKEVAKRGLEAFIYTLGYATDQAGNNMLNQFATHLESLELLEKLGFKVPVQERKLCKNILEVIDFCNYWQQQREGYAYEIDGMVAKVNSRELQERS